MIITLFDCALICNARVHSYCGFVCVTRSVEIFLKRFNTPLSDHHKNVSRDLLDYKIITRVLYFRLVLALSMLYELILIFTLFQHKDDVRRLLVYIDPELGTPLEEMDYR